MQNPHEISFKPAIPSTRTPPFYTYRTTDNSIQVKESTIDYVIQSGLSELWKLEHENVTIFSTTGTGATFNTAKLSG